MSGDSRVWVEVEGRGYVAGSITVHDAGGEQSEVSLSIAARADPALR